MLTYALLRVFLIFLFVAMNAFFAAAEFSWSASAKREFCS